MGLGEKIDGGFCCSTPKQSEATNGHAEVPKQENDWCGKYRQNDVENQTATNAFEFPKFEEKKAERQARRER